MTAPTMVQVRVTGGEFRRDRVPVPGPAPGEVLVRVEYAALNGIDIVRARTGSCLPPGIEFSGHVAAVGPDVSDIEVGTPVMGLAGGGAFAEYVVVPRGLVIERPGWMDPATAGAFCQLATIAYDAVAQSGAVRGDHALVRGALGVIGTGIVQVLGLRGVRSTGIARRAKPDLPQPGTLVLDAGGGTLEGDWDVVFECVGPSHLSDDVRLCATGGTVILLGAIGALDVAVDFLTVMRKRVTIRGTTFSSRPTREKTAVIHRVADELLPHVRAGRMIVPIDGVHPLTDFDAAVRRFDGGSPHGKVLVRID